MYEGQKAPMRKCEYCGVKFYIKGNPKERGKYCSRECSQKGRRSGKVIKCKFCGTPTYKPISLLKGRKESFCSLDCANKYQGRNKDSFSCKVCGKEFRWSKSRKKNAGYSPKYCSIECRNRNPEFGINSYFKANMVQSHKKGLNKIEKIGKRIIDEIGIEYQEQFLIAGKFLVDVFIPAHALVIQWDGEYWHGHPSKIKNEQPDNRQKRRMALDKSQDAYMKKCGLRVARFWECELKERPEQVSDNIRDLLNNSVETTCIDVDSIVCYEKKRDANNSFQPTANRRR